MNRNQLAIKFSVLSSKLEVFNLNFFNAVRTDIKTVQDHRLAQRW